MPWMRSIVYTCITCTAGFVLASWVLSDLSMAQESRVPEEESTDEKSAKKDETAGPLAGHSYHGEAFNEGPRQEAYLMGTTGRVKFPVSTRQELAQKFINQGVGQLHGFWYFEAERSFRQAAKIDPGCRMAYWGMAMANHENEKRARGFIKKAVDGESRITERERLYINGYADYLDENKEKDRKRRRESYIKNLEKIIWKYPKDIEAKAFLAVRLWQFKRDLPIVSHVAVNALFTEIFAAEPMHPAHHYRIHLWDYERPEVALTSAAKCGQAAPGIAHMWHMPGHIFSRLKRYADAAWQQEASARVDHAHMMRDRVLPDQIHNFAHNNEWLTRNLMNVGRMRDAIDLAKNMLELPRHPKYNTLARRGRSASYGRRRLFQVLERYEMWDDVLELAHTAYLEPTDIPKEQAKRLRALGQACFGRNDAGGIAAYIRRLETHVEGIRLEREAARETAEKKARSEDKDAEGVKEAGKKAAGKFKRRLRPFQQALFELQGYEAFQGGDTERAWALLEKGRDLEKPWEAGLRLRAGDLERAEKLAREAVEESEGQVLPLARLVQVLKDAGKRKDATGAFEQLRELAAHSDLDAPPFQRLQTLATELGYMSDWRIERRVPEDVGQRPELEDLGPFRWQPYAAPDWKLPGPGGKTVSLADYHGRPVVVIFYLGYGCLHCVQQLTSFAPYVRRFQDFGISMVAVSTDKLGELSKSVDAVKSDDFPFQLVADPKLKVFKAYRAFDDFEEIPLHGTFLIDGGGKVRWQDISYEPFTNPEFLLKEALRLFQNFNVRRDRL